jgi:hypothetical protein
MDKLPPVSWQFVAGVFVFVACELVTSEFADQTCMDVQQGRWVYNVSSVKSPNVFMAAFESDGGQWNAVRTCQAALRTLTVAFVDYWWSYATGIARELDTHLCCAVGHTDHAGCCNLNSSDL